MSIKDIEDKILERPYIMKMGAGKLSKWFKCTKDDIRLAKQNVRCKSIGNRSGEFNKKRSILILDIETAPLKAYVWGLWNQNVGIERLTSDFFIICWSAKWVGEDHVVGDTLTPDEIYDEDDSRIMKPLWFLLNEADIVVGHNSKKFDVPKINTRFILNGFDPPAPYRQIDTLEIAKREFSFSSNKLDYLAKMFGIEMKYETGFKLWDKCLRGDEQALNQMFLYNNHDVEISELVYYMLRPWMKSHPNMAMYEPSEHAKCTCCGSENIKELDKSFYTNTSEFKIYRCMDCGGISRDRTNMLDKKYRKKLCTSVPK